MCMKNRFVHTSHEYEINQVSPLLEIKRFDLMRDMRRRLARCGAEHFGLQDDLIDTYFTLWLMKQHTRQKYRIDPVFPYFGDDDGSDDEQFIKALSIAAAVPRDRVHQFLQRCSPVTLCNNAVEDLRAFIRGFDQRRLVDAELLREDGMVSVSAGCNTEQGVVCHAYRIPGKLCDKLLHLYEQSNLYATRENQHFVNLLFCILLRYDTLHSLNQQLAVHEEMYRYLVDRLGFETEMFASPINAVSLSYCSLYYDIERFFGSTGYFASSRWIGGRYLANPPFEESIMEDMAEHLRNDMSSSSQPISILVTIPAWDKDEIKYGKYKCLEMLRTSGYLVWEKYIPKDRAVFTLHISDIKIRPTDIYMLFLQNDAAVRLENDLSMKTKNLVDKYYGALHGQLQQHRNSLKSE